MPPDGIEPSIFALRVRRLTAWPRRHWIVHHRMVAESNFDRLIFNWLKPRLHGTVSRVIGPFSFFQSSILHRESQRYGTSSVCISISLLPVAMCECVTARSISQHPDVASWRLTWEALWSHDSIIKRRTREMCFRGSEHFSAFMSQLEHNLFVKFWQYALLSENGAQLSSGRQRAPAYPTMW